SGEQCDDGNVSNGDGCSSLCQNEISSVCGNGALESGEQCDDGNAITENCIYGTAFCAVCAADCSLQIVKGSFCGDSWVDVANGESCDDGNNVSGDGCGATCVLEKPMPSICGNKIVESGEQCDDGNLLNGDGCDSVCKIEPVSPVSVCGNGVLEPGEQCDDG